MTTNKPTDKVSVSKLFCDKITFTIDYPNPKDQQTIAKNMKELTAGKMHSYKGYSKRYVHRIFVKEKDEWDNALQMMVEYLPRASGTSFVRLDFNPAHCDMERILWFLTILLPGGVTDLAAKGKVTRIDLTVDLTGVHVSSLLAVYPAMQVSKVYCKSGMIETLGIGCYEGAKKIILYDKTRQVKEMNEKFGTNYSIPTDPTTRVEICLRPNCGLSHLIELDNPFEKLIVSSIASIPKLDDLTWKLFIAVAQMRGAQDALLMVDDKNLRKAYRERVKGGIAQWWNVTKIWAGWHGVLEDVFMLKDCTPPIMLFKKAV